MFHLRWVLRRHLLNCFLISIFFSACTRTQDINKPRAEREQREAKAEQKKKEEEEKNKPKDQKPAETARADKTPGPAAEEKKLTPVAATPLSSPATKPADFIQTLFKQQKKKFVEFIKKQQPYTIKKEWLTSFGIILNFISFLVAQNP